MKLLNALDKLVLFNRKSIKTALLDTDMVSDPDSIITLTKFYSSAGEENDEINVCDHRQRAGDCQTIYEVSEIDDAITEFLELITDISDN